jgi:hypothetical protein
MPSRCWQIILTGILRVSLELRGNEFNCKRVVTVINVFQLHFDVAQEHVWLQITKKTQNVNFSKCPVSKKESRKTLKSIHLKRFTGVNVECGTNHWNQDSKSQTNERHCLKIDETFALLGQSANTAPCIRFPSGMLATSARVRTSSDAVPRRRCTIDDRLGRNTLSCTWTANILFR